MPKDLPQAETTVLHTARVAVSILFFLNGTIFATWAARLPTVQARLALSPGELGFALLGTSAGALVAMNLAGYLAARFGSRSVTAIAALSLCLILPFLALAPTLPVLVTALIFFGASNGSMDVAMNTQGVAVEREYGRPIPIVCFSYRPVVNMLTGNTSASLEVCASQSAFMSLTTRS